MTFKNAVLFGRIFNSVLFSLLFLTHISAQNQESVKRLLDSIRANTDPEELELGLAFFREWDNIIGTSPGDSIMGHYYHLKGVLYQNNGLPEEAILRYDSCISLRIKMPNKDLKNLLKTYSNIGGCYSNIGNLEVASLYLQESLRHQLTAEQIDSSLLARTYVEHAYTLMDLGDFKRASNVISSVEDLYRIIHNDDPERMSVLYDLIYNYNMTISNNDLAISAQQIKISKIKEVSDYYDREYDLAASYLNLGAVYQQDKQYDISRVNYLNALEYFVDYTDLFLYEALLIESNLTEIDRANGDYKEGLERVNRALNKAVTYKEDPLYTQLLINKADVLVDSGVFLEGLDLLNDLLNQDDLSVSYKIEVSLIKIKALTNYQQLFPIDKSELVSTIDFLIGIIDKSRKHGYCDESLLLNAKLEHDAIGRFIELLYDEAKRNPLVLERIVQLQSRTRYPVLNRELKRKRLLEDSFLNLPNSDEYGELRRKFEQYQRRSVESLNLDEKIEIEQILDKLSKNINVDAAQREYNSNPFFSSLNDCDDFNTHLSSDLLLIYHVGVSNVFLVSHSCAAGWEIIKIGLVDTIKQSVTDFMASIEAQKVALQSYDNAMEVSANAMFKKLSYGLYELLLKNRIETQSKKGSVVIYPDAYLWKIPFEALVTKMSDEEIRYLIQDHEVIYSKELEEKLSKKKNRLNNEISFYAPFTEEVSSLTEYPILSSNRNIQGEFESWTSQTFMGLDASILSLQTSFKEEGIVHLISHAFVNDDISNLTHFLMWDSSGTKSRRVYLNDLYTEEINNEMVVLSMCESGEGIIEDGEGVMSLSRAFLYAGANSVISTLWNINDSKTEVITSAFYKYLRQGASKSEALRQAKLDFIANERDRAIPYYWAAFIPIGDMSPVLFKNDRCNQIVMISIIGFIVLLGIFSFLRKRKYLL